ncbi:MAG: asparagine synthase (glutamine-hydrolyzing) [bacterium]|nr:asparagine synthase (glutamine-hydrolyzing) [bacterium]
MCGICGIVHTHGEPVDAAALERMAKRIAHRGPDAQGIWTGGPAGLGHRRLSIIDLSACGNQPMFNHDKSLALVFNGEIYNFQSIRERLQAKGRGFVSNTDSEVILHLYEEKGIDCLEDLRGMFSFAIWDARRRRLFAARDRIGKKPFKYFYDGKRFIFASELKAILTHPGVPRRVDDLAIHHYINYGYCPPPYTGFDGIHKLPAAHYLLLENGELSIKRYWRLTYAEKEERSEDEWRDAILDTLRESVRLRMISDVPLGVFLSGGLDSSAIVALAAQESSTPLKTFSIGFKVDKYNELPQARLVSEMYQTEHHEFVVEPGNLIEIFQTLVNLYEEPYCDSSALPTYYLAQMARKFVTVALNGDGGDENFAGYERYAIFQRLRDKTRLMRSTGLGSLSRLVPAGMLPATFGRKIQAGQALLQSNPLPFYFMLIGFFDYGRFAPMYSDAFRARVGGVDPLAWLQQVFDATGSGSDDLERALFADFHSYLPEDLMAKVDIATMAHAMEGRSPLLDHRFMELTARIPIDLKLRGGEKKYIFKKAICDLIPEKLLTLPKMGFGIPIHEWFLGELSGWAKDYLLGERFASRGYFRREAIERLWNEHEQKRDRGYYLWSLLMLEEWHRQYID